jgi:hypothetical protein
MPLHNPRTGILWERDCLASRLHILAKKRAVLARGPAFWPVNCILLHKKWRHVAPLSGPSGTDLYSVLITCFN